MLRGKWTKPSIILLLVWLVSRGASWTLFTPTISPDAREYLRMGSLFASLDLANITSNRPFGYGIIIAFLGAKPVLIVLFQQILSLSIALEVNKILDKTRLTGLWSILIPIAFLLYPLTLFLEFQLLSEIVTAFLLMKLTNVVINSQDHKFQKTLILLVFLLSLIALTRPNVLLLAFGIILFMKKLQPKFDYRKMLSIFFVSFLIAAISNFALIGKVFPSSSALTSGIAMHMLDAIPGYDANPALRDSISRAESEVRVNSPGSKYWAIQSGAQHYTESGYGNVDDELVKMNLTLLKEYPLLFLQSFFGSLFSSLYDNPNGFLPDQRFQLPSIVLFISFMFAMFFQFTIIGICFLIFFDDFLVTSTRFNVSFANNYIFAGLFLTLVVNAFVSPVEQSRYMFPLIPVMLIVCRSFLRQKKEHDRYE